MSHHTASDSPRCSAPPHLVFAIYSGCSAEAATQVVVPVQWVSDAEDEGATRLLGLRVDRGSWVTVSVIDEAGNESERSEAVRAR